MDGWIDEWTNGWMNEKLWRKKNWIAGWIKTRKRRMDGKKGEGWIEGCEGWMWKKRRE